jgi:hypothetical protein
MFAPHHQVAADELVRVCRPGGTIGLLSWTPDGMLGSLFRMMGQFAPPPPPGAQPPPLWGSEEHLRGLFGDRLQVTRQYRDVLQVTAFERATDYGEHFKARYGPTISIRANAEKNGLADDFDAAFDALCDEWNRGTADRARFETRDIFETDLSGASVVAFYLLPDFNAKLLPRLLKLKPGTRIVSHDGGIGAWPADEKLEMRAPEKSVGLGGLSKVELWIVPADAAGRWTSDLGAHGGRWGFQIAQQFQVLDVNARAEGRDLLVRASRLRGDEIKLIVTGVVAGHAWHHLFVGRMSGDAISGEVTLSDGNETRRLPWKAARER